jgi:hypothetical protein
MTWVFMEDVERADFTFVKYAFVVLTLPASVVDAGGILRHAALFIGSPLFWAAFMWGPIYFGLWTFSEGDWPD